MPDDMPDEELGAELCPDGCPAFHLWLGASLTGPKRAMYERLIRVGRELQLWEAGCLPLPKGVIITRPTRRRTAA